MTTVNQRYLYKDLRKPDSQTYDEILADLGISFPVEKRDATVPDNNGNACVIPDKVAVWRPDTDQYLSTVGRDYGLVPYHHAFSLAEVLLDEGDVQVICGGPLNRGEAAVLVLRGSGVLQLDIGDDIVNECLLRSTHDGTGKIEVRMTPRRLKTGVVLTTDATRPLSFKHSKGANERVADARKALRRMSTEWEQFTAAAKKLMAVRVTQDDARSFISLVVGDKDNPRAQHIRDRVFDQWAFHSMAPACKGTLFGLVMAFGYWADFDKTVRQPKRITRTAAEFNVRLLGDSAKKKAKAWAMAISLRDNKGLGIVK
jgi:phage/plasmid-like protein (TIGR03299 family)